MSFTLTSQVQKSKKSRRWLNGLARQIASLSTAKSTEAHDHDSYSKQANAICVMRKPSNYNPYANTYNPGLRDHPNFSWSQGFQQNRPAALAPPLQPIPQFLKPLSHDLDHTIRTRITLNPDHGRIHSKISRILLTLRLSNKIAPLMDYKMSCEQASTYKPNQFQASRRWWDNLLLQFRPWQ